MQIGKIPNNILKQIVLDKIKKTRSEVLIGPSIGEDCCALDFGDYACIMSSDPITGTTSEIGRLAVHISCNDIASCGAEPVGLLVTVLAPPDSTENELEKIMDQLTQTAALLNVDIIGGHTEITASVTRFVINCTAVGKALKSRIVNTGGARPGDLIILTKTAGLEGTAIIAYDREKELTGKLSEELIEEAKGFINNISVVKEGLIAGALGVSAMHDATEGGILGAVWEICEASGTGVEIYKEQIPVAMSTLMICEYYNINPLKLISSGCMLITCSDGEGLVKKLKDDNIPAAVIGMISNGFDRLLVSDGVSEQILPPGPDELFKVKGHTR
jgi:hydrogenase expression/formation protein HypE